MSTKTVFVRTDGAGDFVYERPFNGIVHAIEVKIGSLTTPDVDVSDGVYNGSLLSVNGLASDTVYRPGAALTGSDGSGLEDGTGIDSTGPATIMGTLKVVVAGGGDSKRGRVRILYS